MFYHRWCCISMLGAYLGRQLEYKFGHFEFHTNKYIMLIGAPGTRKTTAIKIAKKILTLAGYDKFSADKSSKEKFMLDLAGEDAEEGIDILDKNLWGEGSSEVCEMYIACDEFNDFIGNGNYEFISLLGNLWDYKGMFKNRIKNGKSVFINNPTISILGGNTPTSFAQAFPSEIIGQGFFSRLLLIYGQNTGKRITFPKVPDDKDTGEIIRRIQYIKSNCLGLVTTTGCAEKLIDKIYQTQKPADDVRFEYYMQRRFSHLLKLCMIVAAASSSCLIEEEHVIYANTILTKTEQLMPKALGEFGKSRNSDVSHKVLQILGNANAAMPLKDIWALVHQDLDKVEDLINILKSLMTAGKVMNVNSGFLQKRVVVEEVDTDTLDWSILTKEERDV